MRTLILSLILTINIFSQSDIYFHFPAKKQKITSENKPIYFTGKVDIEKIDKLEINKINVNLDKDGGFVFYGLPKISDSDEKNYYNGIFNIVLYYRNGEVKNLEHSFYIKFLNKIKESSNDFKIYDIILPSGDILCEKNEKIFIKIQATTGKKVWLTIEGVKEQFTLLEEKYVKKNYWADIVFGDGFSTLSDTVQGFYSGFIKINQKVKDATIYLNTYNDNQQIISIPLKYKITTYDGDNIGIATITNKNDGNLIVLRNSPGGGYRFFPLPNTKFEIIGKEGNWVKLKLDNDNSVYANQNDVKYEFKVNSYIINDNISYTRIEEDDNFIYFSLSVKNPLPYEIITNNDSQVDILLYNCKDDIDFIRDLTFPSKITTIKHNQIKDNVVKISLKLEQKKLWGYDVEFNDEMMRFKFRKPPKVKDKKIENLIVSIDPGHSPDFGAVGVYGLKEKDVNFSISMKLKNMLEKKGIKVFLTRNSADEPLDLRNRKKVVNNFSPHILVSIHNNAVPENVNPIKNNGSSVYYYFEQSREFAKHVQKNLLTNLKLNNFGLFHDNLYMCRIPESISILVEPAFIMLPEQERLLRQDEFQEKIAKSIYNAIINYSMENAE
ncbi:MAG TPA: N-acetylmuramoyl-L-alanine amidase [Ignavibacteriales bacterium]|nr:N-acetylmuramoyl-L-alanine amidase [Ignavibacteriales bacterium]